MDGVALASVITSGLLGAGGLGFAAWNANRERTARRREREELTDREFAHRGAEALAPVATLLTNLEPDRMAVNASEAYLADVVAMHARWRDEIRAPLTAFGLSHPSRSVHEKTVALDRHIEWVLVRGVSLIRDLLAGRDHDPMRAIVWSHLTHQATSSASPPFA